MGTLFEALQKTASLDQNDQKAALDYLANAKDSNYAEFLRQLSEVLRSTEADDFVRRAAGLQLKNALVAKDEDLKKLAINQWLSMPGEMRSYIKANIAGCLGTEKWRPSVAAQCVAAVACAELPAQQWPEIISQLMDNVTQPNSTEQLKESSLETLGYICQDIDPSVLATRANEILTAIVHGMKKEERSNHVRLAATTALYNSLEFTKANFDTEHERHVIMQVVCEATISTDAQVKVAALQCLVKIMSLYYQYMEQYMARALFPISLDAMRSTNDDVCLQGIEFWSNVCDEESNLKLEAEEAEEEGRPPEHVSKFYATGALQYIVPILTECLAKQTECDDEDEWTPAKAASVCLQMLAECVGDQLVPHVLPFITQHIQSEDWHLKEAAIMAFGSILHGPDVDKLKGLAEQALPFLIVAMGDGRAEVRDTSAWCIGQVCEVCQEVVVMPHMLEKLLPALSQGLQQEPRVAASVCWALSGLAAAAYDQAMASDTSAEDHGQPATFILTTCYSDMISELNKVTDRPDGHKSNLRIAAYEALMKLITNSPKDCYPVVQETTIEILRKLECLLKLENQITSATEKSQYLDLQSLLCATLQSVVRKMKPEDAPVISQPIMQFLVMIMQRCAGRESQCGGVMEDALIAVGACVDQLGKDFARYMIDVKPFIVAGLKHHADYQVCQAAIGLVQDVCRAFESDALVFLDEFVMLLLEILQDQNAERSLRPLALSVFGDIALAVGSHFLRYAEAVMPWLNAESMKKVDNLEDYDLVDHQHSVRESCLEAYTGIVQGLKASPNAQSDLRAIETHVPHMVQLLDDIAGAHVAARVPDTLVAAAAGLIGDLVVAYGQQILPLLERDAITKMLTRGRRAKSAKTKTLSNWAAKQIHKIKSGA